MLWPQEVAHHDLSQREAVRATEFSAVGRLRPLAHHPDCHRYDHHLLYIAGHPLCLGCACMGAGVALGLFVAADLRARLGASHGIELLVCIALSLPAFVQPFIRIKWAKATLRLILGLGCGFLLFALTAAGWPLLLRLVAAAVFLVLVRAALSLRSAKLDNPCSSCPFGRKPFCAHYLPQLRELSSHYRMTGATADAEMVDQLATSIPRGAST